MLRSLALGVTFLTLASTSAFAQPSLTAPATNDPFARIPGEDEPEVVTTSYRNEILIASGLGVGTYIAGAMAETPGGGDTEASDTLFAVGALGMMFAPGVVHAAHGEYGRGALSVVMRWAAGGLGAMAAMSLSTCDPSKDFLCELDALGPGMLVGVSIASLVDAFAMTSQTTYRPRRAERVLTPMVSATSSGGQLGLAGTF